MRMYVHRQNHFETWEPLRMDGARNTKRARATLQPPGSTHPGKSILSGELITSDKF
jgi:hypothetical protein